MDQSLLPGKDGGLRALHEVELPENMTQTVFRFLLLERKNPRSMMFTARGL
ncbi:MAG TPA: hypothetical protein VHD63_05955 [Ktedonobacteraceae bacterium]|nr:hypothetical protein [Ktedonobacteraceae bacterium]